MRWEATAGSGNLPNIIMPGLMCLSGRNTWPGARLPGFSRTRPFGMILSLCRSPRRRRPFLKIDMLALLKRGAAALDLVQALQIELGVATFGVIILYQLLRERNPQPEEAVTADSAVGLDPGQEPQPGAGE